MVAWLFTPATGEMLKLMDAAMDEADARQHHGQLNLTAIAGRDSCPDVAVFVQGADCTLDELARSALVPAS